MSSGEHYILNSACTIVQQIDERLFSPMTQAKFSTKCLEISLHLQKQKDKNPKGKDPTEKARLLEGMTSKKGKDSKAQTSKSIDFQKGINLQKGIDLKRQKDLKRHRL